MSLIQKMKEQQNIIQDFSKFHIRHSFEKISLYAEVRLKSPLNLKLYFKGVKYCMKNWIIIRKNIIICVKFAKKIIKMLHWDYFLGLN